MGFNIAGLVINQNYDKDIQKLASDLNWNIEVVEEVTFEKASANWTPEDEFRLYFSEKATMIFFPFDWVVEQYHSQTVDTLNYVYSESVMVFQVDLFRKGKLVRSIFEQPDGREEEGVPLALEKEHETADGLAYALIDELLGQRFSDIDLGDKAYRCKKS